MCRRAGGCCARSAGYTPLMRASKDGCAEALTFLLGRGADVNQARPQTADTRADFHSLSEQGSCVVGPVPRRAHATPPGRCVRRTASQPCTCVRARTSRPRRRCAAAICSSKQGRTRVRARAMAGWDTPSPCAVASLASSLALAPALALPPPSLPLSLPPSLPLSLARSLARLALSRDSLLITPLAVGPGPVPTGSTAAKYAAMVELPQVVRQLAGAPCLDTEGPGWGAALARARWQLSRVETFPWKLACASHRAQLAAQTWRMCWPWRTWEKACARPRASACPAHACGGLAINCKALAACARAR